MAGPMWRWLGGDDEPGRRALPVNELFAPLPLAALVVLIVNDWVLKPSSAPAWLTGKLSDVAGLAFFPLLVTASVDLVLLALARLGLGADFTLRRWKLAAAIGLTGAVFAVLKLSPDAAAAAARALGQLTGRAAIMPDPTDLIAAPALALAWWQGRAAIARGALGRLELAERAYRAGHPITGAFADAAACGADPDVVAELDRAVTSWLDSGDGAPVRAALDRLRSRTETHGSGVT